MGGTVTCSDVGSSRDYIVGAPRVDASTRLDSSARGRIEGGKSAQAEHTGNLVLTLSSTTATLPPVHLTRRLRQRTRRPIRQVQEPKQEAFAPLDSAPGIDRAAFLDLGAE